jgi:hypothetical protein
MQPAGSQIMSDSIDVTCPCCSTRLVVDRKTAEVLSHERPPADHEKNFDDAMTAVHGGADRREEAFSKAFKRTRNMDDLLQKKFDEARKKADEDPNKKHRNPLDFD